MKLFVGCIGTSAVAAARGIKDQDHAGALYQTDHKPQDWYGSPNQELSWNARVSPLVASTFEGGSCGRNLVVVRCKMNLVQFFFNT